MIALISLCVGDDQYVATFGPCIDSVKEYCETHGYSHFLYSASAAPERPVSWSRIPILINLMKENPACDWFFWVDADALITNPRFRMELLTEHMIAQGRLVMYSIDGMNNLNDGVALYRNDPRTIEFLEYLWSCEKYIHHPWWVNAAVMAAQAEKREFFETFVLKINNSNIFNSYVRGRSPWKIGDFIVHFAGMRQSEREALIPAFRKFSRDILPFLPAANPLTQLLGI
jgi:galactosyl transferase GMA12/MNN10 family